MAMKYQPRFPVQHRGDTFECRPLSGAHVSALLSLMDTGDGDEAKDAEAGIRALFYVVAATLLDEDGDPAFGADAHKGMEQVADALAFHAIEAIAVAALTDAGMDPGDLIPGRGSAEEPDPGN